MDLPYLRRKDQQALGRGDKGFTQWSGSVHTQATAHTNLIWFKPPGLHFPLLGCHLFHLPLPPAWHRGLSLEMRALGLSQTRCQDSSGDGAAGTITARGTEGKLLLPLPSSRTWGCQKRAQSGAIRHTYFSRLFFSGSGFTPPWRRGDCGTRSSEREHTRGTALASVFCLVKGALSVCHIPR